MQITPPASARSSAVPYSLSNDITFDSETVDTSAEDLELDYRVFTRGGERMLEMTIDHLSGKEAIELVKERCAP